MVRHLAMIELEIPQDMTKDMAVNKLRHALKTAGFPCRVLTLRVAVGPRWRRRSMVNDKS